MFNLGGFNVHHKDWLTYSGETDRGGGLSYKFSISDDLTQVVNFLTQILLTLTVLLFLIDIF